MINVEWNLTEDFLSVEAFSFLIPVSTYGALIITHPNFARQRKDLQWMAQLVAEKSGVLTATASQQAKILLEVMV